MKMVKENDSKGILTGLYEKLFGDSLGNKSQNKGMSVKEVYRKVSSLGNLSEQISYVEEMEKNIEKQHPELLEGKTKNALDAVKHIIEYEKEKGENIGKDISQKKLSQISNHYKNKAEEKTEEFKEFEKKREIRIKRKERTKKGIGEHHLSGEGNYYMENKFRDDSMFKLDIGKNYERASKINPNDDVSREKGIKFLREASEDYVKDFEENSVGLPDSINYDRAANILEKALDLDPKNERLHQEIARLYEKAGDRKSDRKNINERKDFSGSASYYEKALKFDPDDEVIFDKAYNTYSGLVEENPSKELIEKANNFLNKFLDIYEKRGDKEKSSTLKMKSQELSRNYEKGS